MLFQNKKETAFRKIGGFFVLHCEERSNLILGAISSFPLYLFWRLRVPQSPKKDAASIWAMGNKLKSLPALRKKTLHQFGSFFS